MGLLLRLFQVLKYDKDDKGLYEQATAEHIIQLHQKSAVAIVCQFKYHDDPTCIIDVLGLVATLGKVYDDILRRLLCEYLGARYYGGISWMTYDDVKGLETYDT